MTTPLYVESNQPQLFVFNQLFTHTNFDDYDSFLKNFESNLDDIKNIKWNDYWLLHGNDIILAQWKLKYKEYLHTPESEDLQEESHMNEVTSGKTQITAQLNPSEYEQTWTELWKAHSDEVYYDQYILYNSIFNNYQIDLFKSLCFREAETSDHRFAAESKLPKLEEIYYELSLEEEELRNLGLPTAFKSKLQIPTKNKRQPKSEKSKKFQVICDDLEINKIAEVWETSSVDSDMEETESSNLHTILAPTITKVKTKKNRKLKSVPQFILEEKDLLKYWRKRFSLFSLFDKGIRLDRESWFSVTPEKVAANLAMRLKCDIIIDGFCGCGGNTIQFAKNCRKVIAIDIDPIKVEMAKHNAKIYGVSDKIEFIIGDFLQIIENEKLFADVVFLSPPWGGPKYKSKNEYDIEKYLVPIGASELVKKVKRVTESIALFLPRNASLKQIIKLAGIGNRCEIEHNYLDTRLVAITALYGDKIIRNNKIS